MHWAAGKFVYRGLMVMWEPTGTGVLTLPSGRLVRGRGLRRPMPEGLTPTFALYLFGKHPPQVAWESRWIRWPDFRLPIDPVDARHALIEAWRRTGIDRVEIACGGGRGRTGTALVCLTILDGLAPADALAFVRQHYDPRAVETPWQRRYTHHFRP